MTNQHCVSDNVSKKVSRAALNSPATHAVGPRKGLIAEPWHPLDSPLMRRRWGAHWLDKLLRRNNGVLVLGMCLGRNGLSEKGPLTKDLIDPAPAAPSAAPTMELWRSDMKPVWGINVTIEEALGGTIHGAVEVVEGKRRVSRAIGPLKLEA